MYSDCKSLRSKVSSACEPWPVSIEVSRQFYSIPQCEEVSDLYLHLSFICISKVSVTCASHVRHVSGQAKRILKGPTSFYIVVIGKIKKLNSKLMAEFSSCV